MRNNTVFGLALALALAVLAITAAGGNANTRSKEYVVLYAEGASLSAAHGAVTASAARSSPRTPQSASRRCGRRTPTS